MERQPFSVAVNGSNVSVTFNVEDYGLSNITGISAAPIGEESAMSLIMDHHLVMGIAILGDQQKD